MKSKSWLLEMWWPAGDRMSPGVEPSCGHTQLEFSPWPLPRGFPSGWICLRKSRGAARLRAHLEPRLAPPGEASCSALTTSRPLSPLFPQESSDSTNTTIEDEDAKGTFTEALPGHVGLALAVGGPSAASPALLCRRCCKVQGPGVRARLV